MRIMNKRTIVIITLCILGAALFRLVPHEWNFTPLAAMALMSGALFRSWKVALLVPLSCLFLSDAILQFQYVYGHAEFPGFYPEMSITYLSFSFIVGLGRMLRSRLSWPTTIMGAIAGSLLFFILTNLAVFLSGHLYPMTFAGLIDCYTMAIPFFRSMLLGDIFFAIVLYGVYQLSVGSVQEQLQDSKAR